MNAALMPVPIRVLLLESRENRSCSVKQALLDSPANFEVTLADQLSTAACLLQESRYDVALVELGRSCSGVETVDWLTAHPVQVPVVVLVQPDNLGDAFTVLDDTAQEFIVIDRTLPQALEWSIRNSIRRKQQQVELADLQRKINNTQARVRRLTRRLKRQYRTAGAVADRAAHDTRSSLAVIWEYTSILRDGLCGDITPDQAGMLDVVHDRAADLSQMVDAVVDFGKIYTGQLRVVRRICDVSEITGPALQQLAKRARLQGLEFVAEIDTDLPPVFCDPEMVSRILSNLGTRVIKSCGAMGKIRLWAYEEPESQQVVFGINQVILPACKDTLPDESAQSEAPRSDGRPWDEKFCFVATVTRELIERNFGHLTEECDAGRESGPSFDIPLALPEEILERYLVQQRCRPKCPVAVAAVRTWIETDDPDAKDMIDRVLNYTLRREELALRTGDAEWLLIIPADFARRSDVAARIQSIQRSISRHELRRELPQVLMEIDTMLSVQVSATDLLTQASGTPSNQGNLQLCQPVPQS